MKDNSKKPKEYGRWELPPQSALLIAAVVVSCVVAGVVSVFVK